MNNNNDSKYHAFKIPAKLGDEILKRIEDDPRGYRSKTEYIISAIREKMNREDRLDPKKKEKD